MTYINKLTQRLGQLYRCCPLCPTTNPFPCSIPLPLRTCQILDQQMDNYNGEQPITDILVSRTNLSRKQYYSRINRLREAGLIRRKGCRFILTSLGRVVYETHKTIRFAIHNQWKLKAIDSLDTSLSTAGMPTEDRRELIGALLTDNAEIRDILCQSHVKND